MAVQMKTIEQYFLIPCGAVKHVLLHKVVLTFQCIHQILKCDHLFQYLSLAESYEAKLSRGTVSSVTAVRAVSYS